MFTNNPDAMLAYANERRAAIAHEMRTARTAGAHGETRSAFSKVTQAVASHLGFSQCDCDTSCCSDAACC